MPYQALLYHEMYRAWPPRIHNIYTGDVTTDEIAECFKETAALLDQQPSKVDLIGILQPNVSLQNAAGIVFRKDLINTITFHKNVDQIIIVDLNHVLTGIFLKSVLQTSLSRPELKVSILGSMDELNTYLQKKYSN